MNDNDQELPAELRQMLTRHKAPPALERRIRQMVSREAASPRVSWRLREWFDRSLPFAASFACGVMVMVAVNVYRASGNDEQQFEQELVSDHVRSLMAGHLTDVASSDRHTVKPWFLGKLDFAPPVPDLVQQGFPLIGGRLDYLQDRPVAALVYTRRGHTINVFVMPERDARAAPLKPVSAQHGFNVVQWGAKDLRFWAVSDVNRDELVQFQQLLAAAE